MYRESVYEVEDQFSSKVTHNFRTQVLLCLKGKNWTREDILSKTYGLPGYKCHKVARYGYKWSHIHIKFEEEFHAQIAIEELARLNSGLSAVLVDDMLREWYNFEMRFGYGPSWTITVVDTIGPTPQRLNFLTETILSYLFQDFGKPYLLPYTAALKEVHVQMAFSSMTEALAACMAFGQWYRMNVKLDQFCYRVRINPAHRETLLIKNCGGNPDEAFMLDYFVNVRNERIQSREASGWDNNRNENRRYFGNSSQSSDLHHEEMLQNPNVNQFRTNNCSRRQHKTHQIANRSGLILQRTRKHRHQQASIEYQSRVAFQQKLHSPFVCVPIITPVNGAYAQALVSTAQIPADFNALLSFPKTYAEILESDGNDVAENEMLPCSSPEKEIPETLECSNEVNKLVVPTENMPAIPTEKDASDDLNHAPGLDRSTQSSKHPQKAAKSKKCASKRSGRVFERRDVSKQKSKCS